MKSSLLGIIAAVVSVAAAVTAVLVIKKHCNKKTDCDDYDCDYDCDCGCDYDDCDFDGFSCEDECDIDDFEEDKDLDNLTDEKTKETEGEDTSVDEAEEFTD